MIDKVDHSKTCEWLIVRTELDGGDHPEPSPGHTGEGSGQPCRTWRHPSSTGDTRSRGWRRVCTATYRRRHKRGLPRTWSGWMGLLVLSDRSPLSELYQSQTTSKVSLPPHDWGLSPVLYFYRKMYWIDNCRTDDIPAAVCLQYPLEDHPGPLTDQEGRQEPRPNLPSPGHQQGEHHQEAQSGLSQP